MALGVGTGSVLTLASHAFEDDTTTFTVTAQNPALDTTVLSTTGGRTFINPTLYNYTISAEGLWDSTEAFPTAVGAAQAVTWTILGDPGTYTAEAVTTSCAITAPLEELVAWSLELQVSGVVSEA